MYIIIAGGGLVGRSIAKILSTNHDVVVIDPNYDNCEKVSSKIGAVAINGDATKINILRDAGIEKCDVAIGVMADDSLNLLFALLSKNHNVKEIFVRMRDPQYRDAYHLAGATNIGHSVDMLVNKFVLDIENPDIRRVASLSNGKAEICILTMDERAKVIGKKIMEIAGDKNFPKDIVIAGLFDTDKDEFIVPNGSSVIESSYQVFIVGPRDAIKRVHKFMMK